MIHTLTAILCVAIPVHLSAAEPTKKPNIVFILADDLGYGDIGSYGQTKIQTPNLDQLAKDGMRFTQSYAGSTVCAPSRCALMTGLHTGHCKVRGNGGSPNGNVPLGKGDITVAELLKKQGYVTALVGKWGLGEQGSGGVPTKKGFDFFYGYLNQTRAHNYYPPFLFRGETREPIPENIQREKVPGVAEKSAVYSPDLLLKESLGFIEANKAKPFFLYFSTIVPHANNEKAKNEVPTDAPYTSEKWPQPEKDKAAMITRLDADVGKLLAKVKDLGLAENTLVIFTSDNGPHKEGGNDPAFFASSGPFQGIKRSLTEGGIRVPFIARWPGVVKPNTTSDHVTALWDFLPTVAEIIGVETPAKLDGLSILPTLTNQGDQKKHEHLYWEFHENGFKQAVRIGDWKAIRLGPYLPVRVFDLANDPGEKTDLADKQPAIVAKASDLFKTARTDSPEFPVPPAKKK
jgi:arylsulfatase A-like enzyme